MKKASRTGSGRAKRSETSARTAQRAESRRPIDDGEVDRLEALGSRLADLRRSAGLSQARLATRGELAPSTIERLEAGTRRTRRSTLERIARALELPDAAGELVDLAGPTLAPESAYADRIARRRERRGRMGRNRAKHAGCARAEAERHAQKRELLALFRAVIRDAGRL
jgi:transcriptional regulator with XRE-family HTH domain